MQSNQNGSADITVTVTDDGTGTLTDIETFTLTVNAINDAPIATITDTLITLIVSEGLGTIEFALNGSQSFDVDINNPRSIFR